MKALLEGSVGGDGGKAGIYIEENQLAVKLSIPLEKVLEPVNKVIDEAINKLEALVPGDWDKALLEPIRVEAKAALLKLLAE